MTLAELEAEPTIGTILPIACVEGWSIQAHWRGIPLLDLVKRVGGSASSQVTVHLAGEGGAYGSIQPDRQPAGTGAAGHPSQR